jgi:hypothetical protein
MALSTSEANDVALVTEWAMGRRMAGGTVSLITDSKATDAAREARREDAEGTPRRQPAPGQVVLCPCPRRCGNASSRLGRQVGPAHRNRTEGGRGRAGPDRPYRTRRAAGPGSGRVLPGEAATADGGLMPRRSGGVPDEPGTARWPLPGRPGRGVMALSASEANDIAIVTERAVCRRVKDVLVGEAAAGAGDR